MKKSLKLLSSICVLALVAFFASCKDDAPATVNDSGTSANMQNITKAPWKLIKCRSNENDSVWVDVTSLLPSCYLDKTYSFSKDGKVVMDQGPTKCDPDDMQSETMQWGFFENEKKIVFLSDDGPGTILTLDVTTLKILYEIVDGTEKTKLEMTFSH